MELENTLNANFSQADLPELLVQYYQRLFPYKEFFNWLSYNGMLWLLPCLNKYLGPFFNNALYILVVTLHLTLRLDKLL